MNNSPDKIMERLAEKVAERLKKIPSGIAPPDLDLDGCAWEEIAYQLQHGESVFWDLYLEVVDDECSKAYDELDTDEWKILFNYYLDFHVYDDMDEHEMEVAKEETYPEILQELKNTVLAIADNYNLELDEDE